MAISKMVVLPAPVGALTTILLLLSVEDSNNTLELNSDCMAFNSRNLQLCHNRRIAGGRGSLFKGNLERRLCGRFSTPMTANYRPELDYSAHLSDGGINYYMELIGILRWAVELGRIDIMVAVSLLSSYTMQPRAGHLDQVFHVFGYLKRNKRATIIFDEKRVKTKVKTHLVFRFF